MDKTITILYMCDGQLDFWGLEICSSFLLRVSQQIAALRWLAGDGML